MNVSQLRSIERLVLKVMENNTRVLGLISAEPDNGVSSLAHWIAEVSATSGVATLFLNLSARNFDPGEGCWAPHAAPGSYSTTRDPRGFDVLFHDRSLESRLHFNNVAMLKAALSKDFSAYGLVIVELPPAADIPDDAVNPLSAALACDSVILVGSLGVTSRPKLQAATDSMRSFGVAAIGTVVFDAPDAATRRALARRSP